jgi:hypothetical protein
VFSLSVHENTSVHSQCLFVATGIIVCPCRYNGNVSVRCLGNSLPMYALLCERVYNCHLDNDTENLVTEPLSRNGRLLRFRYNPIFSGTAQYFDIRWEKEQEDWKLHNEEFNILYFLPNINVSKLTRVRYARHVA